MAHVLVHTSPVTGTVFNIQRCSVHDGPGMRTTVFLKGCPLRCEWCHNPESLRPETELAINRDRCIGCEACFEVCPNWTPDGSNQFPGEDRSSCIMCGDCAAVCPATARELVGADYRVADLVDEAVRDRDFFDVSGGGVTFSSGEPLSQPEFLGSCLDELRRRQIHTAVDTCGFADTSVVIDIAKRTDLVLFDLKLMDPAEHRQRTGVGNRIILDNLRFLSEHNIPMWIRFPLIPGVTDGTENVTSMGGFLGSMPQSHPVFILPYHGIALTKPDRLGSAQEQEQEQEFHTPTSEAAEAAAQRLASFDLEVHIGGTK